MNIAIRPCLGGDLPKLADIYRNSIRRLGRRYYSPKQISAWSGFADDAASFQKWLEGASIYVAAGANKTPVGFAGIDDGGRIAFLFVSPGHARRGIGSALLERLLEEARSRGLTTARTAASEFSRPLFEKFGFAVCEVEETAVNGVAFSRYAMSVLL
ncbi:MAG: GNAT family N-acetyltransferase [Gammaproteobacteria bacterium]